MVAFSDRWLPSQITSCLPLFPSSFSLIVFEWVRWWCLDTPTIRQWGNQGMFSCGCTAHTCWCFNLLVALNEYTLTEILWGYVVNIYENQSKQIAKEYLIAFEIFQSRSERWTWLTCRLSLYFGVLHYVIKSCPESHVLEGSRPLLRVGKSRCLFAADNRAVFSVSPSQSRDGQIPSAWRKKKRNTTTQGALCMMWVRFVPPTVATKSLQMSPVRQSVSIRTANTHASWCHWWQRMQASELGVENVNVNSDLVCSLTQHKLNLQHVSVLFALGTFEPSVSSCAIIYWIKLQLFL